MLPSKSDLPHYYLKAGEMFIMEKPALISTVLGSCIALTLFNQRKGLAGICHALLPQCIRKSHKTSIDNLLDDECHKCLEAFKYADCSVYMMAESFIRFGITPRETEVRLFGGAKMMVSRSGHDGHYSIGQQNIDTARKVISYCHLELASSDVGGTGGRKIIFNTKTGEVEHHSLNQSIFRKVETAVI